MPQFEVSGLVFNFVVENIFLKSMKSSLIFRLSATILTVCTHSHAALTPASSSVPSTKDPSNPRQHEHSTIVSNVPSETTKAGSTDEEESKKPSTSESSNAPTLNESIISVIRKGKTKASFRCKGTDCSQVTTQIPMRQIDLGHPGAVGGPAGPPGVIGAPGIIGGSGSPGAIGGPVAPGVVGGSFPPGAHGQPGMMEPDRSIGSLGPHSQVRQQAGQPPNQGQGQGGSSMSIPSGPGVGQAQNLGIATERFHFIASIRKAEAREAPHGIGSIINPQWVLTTRRVAIDAPAHAAGNNQPPPVKQGSLLVYPKYSEDFSALGTYEGYEVEKAFCFPFYWTEDRATNYPALMKLKKPIPMGEAPFYFEKIDLIDPGFQPYREKEFSIGSWTLSRQPPNYQPFTFQKSHVKTLQMERCHKMQQQMNLPDVSEFCTEHFGGIFCKDMSGSPVVVTQHGKKLLAGYVAFFGDECSENSDKRVNLATYRTWVDEIMTRENPNYECKNIFKIQCPSTGAMDFRRCKTGGGHNEDIGSSGAGGSSGQSISNSQSISSGSSGQSGGQHPSF
ncbi:uncharacterized protein LOC141856751 [Brevipalpus obovatus]|uniref:uncharacterized protein LOC141856751 n=1 Tax=Brevipalpus obovatus TaxID=246614 RepID=UPI003D9F89A9